MADLIFRTVYGLILTIIHTIYAFYTSVRSTYNITRLRIASILNYHHRTPANIRKDVALLKKLPDHVAVILESKGKKEGGVEKLIDEVADLSCWCASVGVATLTVYQKTGMLKNYETPAHRAVSERLHTYFGSTRPTFRITSPHSPNAPSLPPNGDAVHDEEEVDLEINFVAQDDGRESIVDFTRALSDLAQGGKFNSEDVSVDLIDQEMKASVMGEPDLLILFTPRVFLQGFPPWQIRLTEIFHLEDNEGVSYTVFLKALHKFAGAEMRWGR
ncbi:Undecaprenyl diphosphate synthase [Saitoella complicata NRRL Y-17804]|uniref:ditrans,polycis-polyprenyl diphosphate synthase [(2E,6E)-farnesyldiphosphate specific] n=1 Tax=Saitoella complicata (strain BCRC 22490 / CBS 7301 / JCM 7358 / NBRC 10748 / NRRL Y-17804) TaxID=698492 RepID=A0A0E9NSE3_SAICN|nr:Undecaprenyl diphosphate synthase [Saitoella complicata NRRL Y-17804]ODQ52380.1 Undecaprenyl diphosphate synthase [Saitoella complicata NRRL Y-17804]GAO52774.1 hypothetical protein G7K_6841-t1 [Saitoella complicata NRRL Y-17804]